MYVQGVSSGIFRTSGELALGYFILIYVTHLHPKLTSYRNTTREKRVLFAFPPALPVLHNALRISVLELKANASHAEASVLCNILRNITTIFMKFFRLLLI